MVDRAEDRLWGVFVQERAGTVVDGLAGDRGVVGVHHAVDEADPQPAGDQLDLGRDHRFEQRSEEHTSELQSLMRISYAVFCLKKKTNRYTTRHTVSSARSNACETKDTTEKQLTEDTH